MQTRTADHLDDATRSETHSALGTWDAICRWLAGHVTDETLVRRARAGDFRAFDTLVARHRDRLYGLALRSVRDEAEATEAVVETVLAAFRSLDSFSGTCSPAAWLQLHALRVLLNRAEGHPARYRVVRSPASGARAHANA